MDALGANKYGPYHEVLELLHFAELPKCEKPDDVLIKINYSDVNPVDLQKLAGSTTASVGQAIPNGPLIPGYGGAGMVVQVGTNAPQQLVGKDVVFLADPTRPGSYASHIVVDKHCIAEVPSRVQLRDAASIPVAGLTAYECLVKLGLARNIVLDQTTGTMDRVGLSSNGSTSTPKASSSAAFMKRIPDNTVSLPMNNSKDPAFLVVGGSGGVGSWLLTLVHAFYPDLMLYATATHQESQNWCKSLGASVVVGHSELEATFCTMDGFDERQGCIDNIVCLTEPTPSLMSTLSKLIRPYGQICLVVSGASIKNLDLSFCFYKCVNILTQTVFTSIRTKYRQILPKAELKVILSLLENQTISAPICDLSEDAKISEKFYDVLKPDKGLLQLLDPVGHPHYPRRGNIVMFIASGNDLIFLDLKTASILAVPRKECIEKKYITSMEEQEESSSSSQSSRNVLSGLEKMHFQEQANGKVEKEELIRKITTHKTLGIVKIKEKHCKDNLAGIALEEAEQVQNLWGVRLKKRREKNVKGEEFIFVDPRLQVIGELSRNACIEKGLITIQKATVTTKQDDDAEAHEVVEETLAEAITDPDEREHALQTVREALQLHLPDNNAD